MSLIKWDPFQELSTLHDRIERLFEESTRLPRVFGKERQLATVWTPPVDIYETDDAIILKAELPGIKPDEVDIQIRGDVLTIKGERKQEKEEKGKNFHRIERSYGTFQRSFTLGIPIKDKDVKATFKDGILEVNLPKAEEVKPKQIKVKVE